MSLSSSTNVNTANANRPALTVTIAVVAVVATISGGCRYVADYDLANPENGAPRSARLRT